MFDTDNISSKKKHVYLVNFGVELNNEIIKEIETKHNCIISVFSINVRINLKKNIYIQVVDLVDQIPVSYINSEYLIINPPQLSIAAVYILIEVYARLKKFPYIIELKRDKTNNIFADFTFGKIRDLSLEIHYSRNKLREQQLTQHK
jgi:hypothetical protein